jgi:hypothetical protein
MVFICKSMPSQIIAQQGWWLELLALEIIAQQGWWLELLALANRMHFEAECLPL